jgi:hypothetical protein
MQWTFLNQLEGNSRTPNHIMEGVETMDNLHSSLTQKRSQVRVLFRPLNYPHPWGCFSEPTSRGVAGCRLMEGPLPGATVCNWVQRNWCDKQIYLLCSLDLHAWKQVAIHIQSDGWLSMAQHSGNHNNRDSVIEH